MGGEKREEGKGEERKSESLPEMDDGGEMRSSPLNRIAFLSFTLSRLALFKIFGVRTRKKKEHDKNEDVKRRMMKRNKLPSHQ